MLSAENLQTVLKVALIVNFQLTKASALTSQYVTAQRKVTIQENYLRKFSHNHFLLFFSPV